MGIVAPVTGVLAAVIPVVAGIVARGLPGAAGASSASPLAIVAVVLVSRVADEGGGRAGLAWRCWPGSAIGLFGVAIAQLSDGHVFGPLVDHPARPRRC